MPPVVDIIAGFHGLAEGPPTFGTVVPRRGVAASVTLRNGSTYTLNPRHPFFLLWSRLIRSRAVSRMPVYVEAELEGEQVIRLLAPEAREIVEILRPPAFPGPVIATIGSPAPFYVRLGHPSFDEFLALLESARQSGHPVLVTDDPDSHEILDVRPFESSSADFSSAESVLPVALTTVLTDAEATAEFIALSQTTIPFDYVDSCCCARAHEMFRLLGEHGFACKKIWNFPTTLELLVFYTPKAPNGTYIPWVYHVAPLVQVKLADGSVVERVIDPSTRDKPELVKVWRDLQYPSVTESEAPEIYYRNQSRRITRRDDDFRLTNKNLACHRYHLAGRRKLPPGPGDVC